MIEKSRFEFGRNCRFVGNSLLGAGQAFLLAAVLLLTNGWTVYADIIANHEVHYSIVTIEPGQDLVKLAADYHTTKEEILKDNGINGSLQPGQTLTIKENTYTKPISRGSGGTEDGWEWPLLGKITQDYGWVNGDYHHGIDIAASEGTKIRAAFSGRVAKTGWLGVYGRTVLLNHGNGIQTLYAHNSQIVVKTGQYVHTGEVIAYSGSTGNSTGPHLHFEVRVDGLTVEPENYLPEMSVASTP